MTVHPTFYLLAGRDILRSCIAPDRFIATLILNPQKDEYVLSRADHALGFRAPSNVRFCTQCGYREAEDADIRCVVCERGRRKQARGERKDARKAYRERKQAERRITNHRKGATELQRRRRLAKPNSQGA